jgi:sigma-B regulation protein RsbU (phosphoserine phosphatase)
VPILVREDLIGLIYVDNRLRVGLFNETHRDLLAAFASEAGFAIENARLYQVAIEKGRLQNELEMARRIQEGLLPSQFTPLPGYEVAFAWQSAREVAGDFYDCFILDNHRMGIVVADVSDKGAAAAIFMAVSRSSFRGIALASHSLIETVQQTNHLLLDDATNGMFVTLYYSVFETGGHVQGVNAGHNLPIRYRNADSKIEIWPRGGHPLGWFPSIPLHLHEEQMEPGDIVVFYTDGLTEVENARHEPFGEHRLAEAIRTHAHASAAEIKQAILEAVSEFEGDAPPFDDLTLVVVRYVGQA